MASTTGPHNITDGLVLALDAGNIKSYPGSGTSWVDLSNNGNNATLVNTPTHSDGNLTFNGSTQYAQANSVTDEIISGDFTLMAMIKGSTQDHKSILSFNTSTGGNRQLWMVRHAGMGMHDGGTWYIGSTDVDNNQWHLVTATYDYSTKGLKTYTDGVLDLDVTTTNQINVQSSDTANIGMEYDGGTATDHFNGSIPMIYIYNRVLSQEEITQIYDSRKTRFT
jgi:hypothetical protein